MAARKRNPLQVAQDEQEISRLHLRGDRQEAIGRKLNLSQPMVSYSVKRLRERMNAKTTMNIEAARDRELAVLDKVEACAWEGWERADRQGDSGAVRFAAVILKASDQRAALLALPDNPPTPAAPADDIGRQQRFEAIRSAFAAKVLRDYFQASGQRAGLTNGATLPPPTLPAVLPESAEKRLQGYQMS